MRLKLAVININCVIGSEVSVAYVRWQKTVCEIVSQCYLPRASVSHLVLQVMSWNDVWEEHIKPRLFRVCPRTFYDHQMTVLLKIYKSEDMANDSRRFTEWFDRASGTICELCKRPRDTSCQQVTLINII